MVNLHMLRCAASCLAVTGENFCAFSLDAWKHFPELALHHKSAGKMTKLGAMKWFPPQTPSLVLARLELQIFD